MLKPKLKLSNKNGNAFAILARAMTVAKNNNLAQKEIDNFLDEAKSGDYDHLLQVMMKYFDVE